jgi:hypothetical protein
MAIWNTQEMEHNLKMFLSKRDFENGKSMKPAKARHSVSNGGLWYYQYWTYDITVGESDIHSVLN